jgi:hypothetical protein
MPDRVPWIIAILSSAAVRQKRQRNQQDLLLDLRMGGHDTAQGQPLAVLLQQSWGMGNAPDLDRATRGVPPRRGGKTTGIERISRRLLISLITLLNTPPIWYFQSSGTSPMPNR